MTTKLPSEFPDLLRYWRTEKRGMTQKELGEKSGLGKIVVNYESGKVANYNAEYVKRLADALALTGFDRETFFYAAGVVDPTPTPQEITPQVDEAVHSFYQVMDMPAFVDDAFFDLHSFNSYAAVVLGLNVEDYQDMLFDHGGPNILRILFDSAFSLRQVYAEAWEAYAKTNLFIFKASTRPYRAHKRYVELMEALDTLPDFTRLWEEVENTHTPPPQRLMVSAHTDPEMPITFLVAESLITRVNASSLKATCYLPANEFTIAVFESFRSNIRKTNHWVNWKERRLEAR